MKQADHPHILLICTDEQAPQYMGCMGHPYVRTPNLDRLAQRGVCFRNGYCNNPICVPGRYSILTGQYVRELGSLHYSDGLNPRTWTYPKHFARAGYQTTCVGKQHFMGLEQMHGWMFRPYGDMELVHAHYKMPGFETDPYAETDRHPLKQVEGELAGWVRDSKPSRDGVWRFDEHVTVQSILHLEDYFRCRIQPVYNPERPLLFEASYKAPHWPYWAPKDLFDYYRQCVTLPAIPDELPPTEYLGKKRAEEQHFENTPEEILNARAAYFALIEWVDGEIGKLLNALEALGVLDDFLIIMHADHGDMAGNHGLWNKGCAYEHAVRTPMMISWPGRIPAGKVIDTPVSNVDIFPTLCDYAGLGTPEGLRGRSWRPLIDAGDPPSDFAGRTIISECFKGPSGWVMARRGDIKLVDYWYGHRGNEKQLFDLRRDPQELTNCAGDPGYKAIQHSLQEDIDSLPTPFTWNEDAEKLHHLPETGPPPHV
jgi:choline-sulfatase